MRRLRVQVTVLVALLGLLVVAWGSAIFLAARDAARSGASLQSAVERVAELRRAATRLSLRWRVLTPVVEGVADEYRAWARTGHTELAARRERGARAAALAVRTALMLLGALVLLAIWLRRAVGAPADAELRLVLSLSTLRAGQVVDMADLDQVTTGFPVLGDLVARMGVASLALVPLLSRGRFLGLLALCWTERHQLNREQEALLGLAGNQIAGACEAALRLEEAERAAGEAQAVFYAIADGVLLTDPYGRVTAMNRALEAVTGWTEAEARGRVVGEST